MTDERRMMDIDMRDACVDVSTDGRGGVTVTITARLVTFTAGPAHGHGVVMRPNAHVSIDKPDEA